MKANAPAVTLEGRLTHGFSAALALLAVGAALLPLVWPTLVILVRAWWLDPNYSHGFAVPFISGWLAWRHLSKHGVPAAGEVPLGCALLLAGGVVHLAAVLIGWPPLDFLALVMILRGLAVALGGRQWAGGFTFPILFLFFMFPLPVSWTSVAALWLQDVVSTLSAILLDPFLVVHLRGHTLHIAGVTGNLVVAPECSGLRQIVAFVALGALLGHLFRKPLLFSVLLILASIPIAIFANVVRVVLMALGARWFGSEWMSGWLHDTPALLTLPLGLVLFALVGLWLGRFWAAADRGGENYSPQPPLLQGEGVGGRGPGLLCAGGCLALVLGAQVGLRLHLGAAGEHAYPELARGLDALPLAVKGPPLSESTGGQAPPTTVWQGRPHPQQQAVRARLPFQADDMLMRLYHSDAIPYPVELYLVHSRVAEDRKHHPEVCLRDVAGAPEDTSARGIVYLDAELKRPAQRFRFRTGTTEHTTVYYWHYTFSPQPREGQTFLQALHQRLSQPAPSVTVQVSTLAPPEQLAAVENTFLPALDAALQAGQLPARTRVGCERLNILVIRE
jgi:exosortase